jgi:magnesium-transporting ATPase (P-type)
MCWDKTGTLTTSDLYFEKLDPSVSSTFQGATTECRFTSTDLETNPYTLERVMVACHQLTNVDNNMIGHSLDIETVKHTKWRLSNDINQITINSTTLPLEGVMNPPVASTDFVNGLSHRMLIFKRFEFDAQLQASSVIAASEKEAREGNLTVYCKGSPEAMLHLCISETLPDNFTQVLHSYSIMGFYVIACGYRKFGSIPTAVTLSTLKRKSVERELTFLGLLLFQNPLKEEAIKTIESLRESQIRNVIITGVLFTANIGQHVNSHSCVSPAKAMPTCASD